MASNVETRIASLPDGGEVHWSRQQITPEAARLFADQAAGKRYRLLTLSEREGAFSVHHVELPGERPHVFLFDWEDGPGEGKQVLSVEAVGSRQQRASARSRRKRE